MILQTNFFKSFECTCKLKHSLQSSSIALTQCRFESSLDRFSNFLSLLCIDHFENKFQEDCRVREETDATGWTGRAKKALIALASTICTHLSHLLLRLQKSFDCWFLLHHQVANYRILRYVASLAQSPSFTHAHISFMIAPQRKTSQSASATWSRYSCSLVIDIFDSSFFLLPFPLSLTHSHNIHYVRSAVLLMSSDKPVSSHIRPIKISTISLFELCFALLWFYSFPVIEQCKSKRVRGRKHFLVTFIHRLLFRVNFYRKNKLRWLFSKPIKAAVLNGMTHKKIKRRLRWL